MNPEQLGKCVRSYFREHASRFGLRAPDVEVRYVLNWGGFVNASFTVADGQRAYHLKLAADAGNMAELRRWHCLHPPLTERYHAPEVVDWITLPDGVGEGLLFPHLPGRAADLTASPDLAGEIIPVLHRLHADEELAAQLQPAEYPDCGAYFRGTVGQCDREDLLFIREQLPPFVSAETLAWMEAEVMRLDAWTRTSAAFTVLADRPVHSDTWSNNILVGEGGRWHLLDWDNLCLGDPMLDFAILLWPVVHAGRGELPPEYVGLAPDPAARERLVLYLRACLLDSVVDVLADWIDVEAVPEHRDHVRAVHQVTHERCLALYRQRYE
jgi:hypothetical protein